MAHGELSLDWNAVYAALSDGSLLALLLTTPRARWADCRADGDTLLHIAARGNDVATTVALLESGLVDMNASGAWCRTPAHTAADYGKSRVLEVLCAAGADTQRRDGSLRTPLQNALWTSMLAISSATDCIRVLVANGARLSTASDCSFLITPELEEFERGVLRCRAAVVAMLRVKRAGKLWMWDKFLLAEIAVAVWATRYDKKWQQQN